MGKYSVTALALSYSLLVMTHLPTALFVSIFLLPYVTILQKYTSCPKLISKFFFSIAIGIMLSGAYLVPALLSQDYITVEKLWQPYYQYHRWFFLDGVDSPNPGLETKLLIMLLCYSLAFFPAWFIAHKRHTGRKRVMSFAWFIFFVGAWFLMLPFSRFVWEFIPFLQKVQFPWRVLVIVDITVVSSLVLAMQSVQGMNNRRLFFFLIGISVLFCTLSFYESTTIFQWHWHLHKDEVHQAKLNSALDIGYDPHEYIPSSVKLSRRETWAAVGSHKKVSFVSGNGAVNVVQWDPRIIGLDVNLVRETELRIRQFHYPGWQAEFSDNDTKPLLVPSGSTGIIKMVAPAGQYKLTLSLQPLWQEVLGWISSGIACLILICHSAIHLLRRNHLRTSN